MSIFTLAQVPLTLTPGILAVPDGRPPSLLGSLVPRLADQDERRCKARLKSSEGEARDEEADIRVRRSHACEIGSPEESEEGNEEAHSHADHDVGGDWKRGKPRKVGDRPDPAVLGTVKTDVLLQAKDRGEGESLCGRDCCISGCGRWSGTVTDACRKIGTSITRP